MKTFFAGIFIAALFLAGGCCHYSNSETAPVVIGKSSDYRIVLPDKADGRGCDQGLMMAAKMLQQAFKNGIGKEYPIIRESRIGSTKAAHSIYLGETKVLQKLGVNTGSMGDFDAFIGVNGNDIFIAGRDRKIPWLSPLPRNTVLGSVRGAVLFAEKFLGTRFLYPGETGIEYAENLKQITVPGSFRKIFPAPLVFATGRLCGFLYDYSNANYGSGFFKSYGGHSYYDAVPVAKYRKTHPEYFALINGNRTGVGNHLCISNQEVQNLIYAEALRRLDAGAEVVQLAQTDGYQPCVCEKCQAYGNTSDHGEKLWKLHLELAQRLLKDRPGKKLHIISYHPTEMPPKGVKEFPPNVIVEICKYTPEHIAAWKKVKVPGGFTVYIYNWGCYQTLGYTPKRTPAFAKKQIEEFRDFGVIGIYRCGFGENFGLEAPAYYAYGKLLENPDLNEEKLADEFYTAAFKEVSPAMREFYKLLFARLDIYLLCEKSFVRQPRQALNMIYTSDLVNAMEKKLSVAEQLARDSKVKLRLAWVRAEFDYVKNLADCLRLYDAYKRKPTQPIFDELASLIEKRNVMVKAIIKNPGISKVWPEARLFSDGKLSQYLPCNGRLSAPIQAPLNWNIPLLRSKKVLPGTLKRSMEIPFASGAVTMDFESGAWKNVPWSTLEGVRLQKLQYKNSFKCLYDKKNFYLALRGDIKNTRFITYPKDGPVWCQDCIDLFLDPTGTGENYFHFIANPSEGSVYDEALGLIHDPLHPNFGKPDKNWNGKWSCKSVLKNGKWEAMLTIPFETMQTQTPASGAVWKMNLGRETYDFDPNEKNSTTTLEPAELALWSPNLESDSFQSTDALGEIRFK